MILTMRERVGVPEDVLARTPIIERKRIPTAKVQFKLEKGMRTTMMDWGMAQGLLLLGFFTRATTCEKLMHKSVVPLAIFGFLVQ